MTELPAKPAILTINPDNIPQELRAIRAWVGWRSELEGDRWTKKPVEIKTGNLAETDNLGTWCDFETALQNYKRRGCDGIGLCRTGDLVFIDLDGVFGEGNLHPFPWATKILTVISGRSYMEKSVTGTGLHGITRGALPEGRRQFDDPDREHTGFALYDKSRFFTFSGDVVPGSGEIQDLTPELAALHRELFPDKTSSANPGANFATEYGAALPIDDFELLERARCAKNGAKFSRLFDGDWRDYASQSEADSALCFLLAFWTGRDVGRIDGLFRQSGLMREKWLRDDYRAMTIANACQATTDVWEPRRQNCAPIIADARKSGPAEPPNPRRDELPRICSNGRQLREVSLESLQALRAANNPPVLFARNGMLVAVVLNEKQRMVISEVGTDALCGYLTRCADYFKVSANGRESNCSPPAGAVKDILALPPGEWGFPSLDAVTEVPILRPDGSILESHGYDPATQLYYAPDPDLQIPQIPDQPGREHIQNALDVLDAAIGEFPYVDAASYANALAALLTPIIKPAINAPAPMGVLDAPQPGTGKSLLCDVIAIVATGRAAEMFSAPKDEDEWRKVITTALMSGTAVVIFDNITRPLENGDLCSVLTANIWADRAMKTHDKIALPVKATFLASGNNVRLAGDMPRRCYQIRLDAKTSDPFLRTGPEPGKKFKIPDLNAWCLEHRGELLAALLTLARAWYVAGNPKPAITPTGSFERWTITVGGILEFAGIKGFMENAVAMYKDADDESREWEGFLLTLDEVYCGEAFTVADIADKLNEKHAPGQFQSQPTQHAVSLRAALPGFLAEGLSKEGLFTRRTGKAFAAKVDRRFGRSGVHLMKGTMLTGKQQWLVSRPDGSDHTTQRHPVG